MRYRASALTLAVVAETEEGPPQGVAGGPPHFVSGMRAELTAS